MDNIKPATTIIANSPWSIVRLWHANCSKCFKRIRKYTEGVACIPTTPAGWEMIEGEWYCKNCIKNRNMLKLYNPDS